MKKIDVDITYAIVSVAMLGVLLVLGVAASMKKESIKNEYSITGLHVCITNIYGYSVNKTRQYEVFGNQTNFTIDLGFCFMEDICKSIGYEKEAEKCLM